jgi:D-3-phosphoglycerate dehydrogenase / 2-oxoglutarate reductase
MNPGAIVVNCARGGLIDEAAPKPPSIPATSPVRARCFRNRAATRDHPLVLRDKTSSPRTSAHPPRGPGKRRHRGRRATPRFPRHRRNPQRGQHANLDSRTRSPRRPLPHLARALGKLLPRLGPGNADSLRVSYHGPVAKKDTGLVSRTVLTAFLELPPRWPGQHRQRPGHRRQLGLDMVESTINAKTNSTNSSSPSSARATPATVSPEPSSASSPRIVEMDQLYVDCNIAGRFLFVENDDRPGIVGVVGTALGTRGQHRQHGPQPHQRPLARRHRHRGGHRAARDLLEKLRATPGIIRVLSFEL